MYALPYPGAPIICKNVTITTEVITLLLDQLYFNGDCAIIARGFN